MEKLPEKSVILMRHAKSDWGAGLADFDRPLNSRGERDAEKMSEFLVGRLSGPVTVICSAARRSHDTAMALARAMPTAEMIIEQDLYLASVRTLYRYIEGNQQPGCLILVAHNPGLEELLLFLYPEVVSRIGSNKLFPTCAVHAFGMSHCKEPSKGRKSGGSEQEFRYLFHQRPKALS